MSSGGARFPSAAAQGHPFGTGGAGQRDGCSGCHQDNVLLPSCLNNMRYVAVIPSVFLVALLPLVIFLGLALECVFYPSQEDCQF